MKPEDDGAQNQSQKQPAASSSKRVADHRKKLVNKGLQRFELLITQEVKDSIFEVAKDKKISTSAAAIELLTMGFRQYKGTTDAEEPIEPVHNAAIGSTENHSSSLAMNCLRNSGCVEFCWLCNRYALH